MMTRLFIVLFAVLLAYQQASGASSEYCRPHAAQTAELLVKFIWMQAYTSCLNSDDDPELAKTPEDAIKEIVPIELLLSRRPEKIVADPPTPRRGRSGYAANTPEWNAYCKKYWPASFDRKSGTVIKTGHKRIPCPG